MKAYFVTVTRKYFLLTVPLLSLTFTHISYSATLAGFTWVLLTDEKFCFVVHLVSEVFL